MEVFTYVFYNKSFEFSKMLLLHNIPNILIILILYVQLFSCIISNWNMQNPPMTLFLSNGSLKNNISQSSALPAMYVYYTLP